MKKLIYSCILGLFVSSACQKMERPTLGAYPSDTPVVPSTALRFYVPFDSMSAESGTKLSYRFADSISTNPSFPVNSDITFASGIRSTAYKGATGTAIKYVSANDMRAATSFTVAFWVKQTVAAATGRTEFYFSLVDDSYGWSHSGLFMMVENVTSTDATVKVGVMDQWLEFAGNNKLKTNLFNGAWHHWAMTYDEATSKMAYFVDGVQVASPPAAATDVKKDGAARGKLDFSKSSYLAIGGWNAQVGLTGPTDDWVKSFTGSLDQFRMYNKVLTNAEILELYNNKL